MLSFSFNPRSLMWFQAKRLVTVAVLLSVDFSQKINWLNVL